MNCKCGKRKTESGLGQGYFDQNGYHYQCPACFKRANPRYFKLTEQKSSSESIV